MSQQESMEDPNHLPQDEQPEPKKCIVQINLEAPYEPSVDCTPNEELKIRLEAVLGMAQLIQEQEVRFDNRVNSIIIDADKALKILNRKRWWEFWK